MENKQVVNKKEIVKKLLKQEIDIQDEQDLLEMLIDKPITIDVDKQKDNGLKCYIETAALVFHSDIDKKLNEEFGKEF